MPRRPTVRWNEGAGRWMAWVRFLDGSRRKVERVGKADAQRDLDELLALRAQEVEPGPRRTRLTTFNEVIDAWMAEGCPNVAPSRTSRHARVKSPNTIANARHLLGTSVRPAIGPLWVDRTSTERLERVFAAMADDGYATSPRPGGAGAGAGPRVDVAGVPAGLTLARVVGQAAASISSRSSRSTLVFRLVPRWRPATRSRLGRRPPA